MHQRIGVDHFHRRRRRIQQAQGAVQQTAGGIHQLRAQALAAVHAGITHGAVQSLRLRHLRRQAGIQYVFAARAPLFGAVSHCRIR